MRRILLSVLAIVGLALTTAVPASANAAGVMVSRPAQASESSVVHVGHWHHGHRGGLSIGFGWGYPRYYGYPRYSYYDDYSYYRPRTYYRPSYSYYAPVRHHRRHWCNRHDRYEW